MRVLPRGAVLGSDGEDAVFLASSYGLTADDWQADVVGDWLLRGRKGIWLATTCGLAVPRQNGKNAVIEIRELFGMVVLGEKFLHTAHEVKTARKAFKRLKHFFGEMVNDPNAKFPELNALVKEVRSTNGQEAIILHHADCGVRTGAGGCHCGDTGGSVEFVARSKGSGRGFTVDVLVCDEAQDLTDEELEALLPTISAAPLGNPQIIFTGTPPNPEKNQTGEVFTRVRNDAGDGTKPAEDRRLAWTDFGVADLPLEELDLDSVDELYAHNPALDVGRLQLEVCRTERRRMSPAGYARERYGWWGNPGVATVPVFGDGAWDDIELDEGDRPTPGAIGVAVSIDQAYGSIGVIGEWEDGTHLIGAVDRRRGTGWLVAEAKRIQDETGCAVVVDGKGPGSFLIQQLQDADVTVTVTSSEDYLTACAELFAAVQAGDATHMGDDELTAAVLVAMKRAVGDRWAWARKSPLGDISMLEAVTLAWFGRELGWYDVGDSVL